MLQTYQVLNLDCVTTTTGKPVKILNAPPNYNFVLTKEENGKFGIFCVDCGLWICYADTRKQAIAHAEGLFYHHSRGRYLLPYLYNSKMLFYAYLNYIWQQAATCDLFPGPVYIQGGLPKFPFKNED